MRANKLFTLVFLALVLGTLSCNLPAFTASGESATSSEHTSPTPSLNDQSEKPTDSIGMAEQQEESAGTSSQAIAIDPSKRIQPSDLVYRGAFRLPGPSGGSDWDYSGSGFTHYPDGDPNGADDGFPGSLFGLGHDHQLFVSEINIPAPVNTRDLGSLPIATTLQPFGDLTGGIFAAEEMDIPVAGIEYLPPQGDQTSAKLHFVWGQHFQEFEPSHGWGELDLTNPQSAGPWVFNGYSNYVTSDYLFEIPQDWSDLYAPGLRLATGRAREGLWSGRGPALFAYAPWLDGNPPAANAVLTHLVPLLLYGTQEPGSPDIVSDESTAMAGYTDSDHWVAGAWLTAADKGGVFFVGTIALGDAWYGFANGVVWPHDCAENDSCPEPPEWPYDNRGYWAEDFEAQMVFYDPAELAAVAAGQMETWEPQPYAVLSLQSVLFEPDINPAIYRRDLIGSAAFDRANGLLYVVERLVDEYKSVVHVWELLPK
jgi:hypothetical protein